MTDPNRTLLLLEGLFAICRLDKDAPVPSWASEGDFYSVTRTPDELCVVCSQAAVPAGVESETGWRCLKIESPFGFDLSGAILEVAVPLAKAELKLFVVATKDSDYLMVRKEDLERATSALSETGHEF